MQKLLALIDKRSRLIAFFWAIFILVFFYLFFDFTTVESYEQAKRLEMLSRMRTKATPLLINVDPFLTSKGRMRLYETMDLDNCTYLKGWAFLSDGPAYDSLYLILQSTFGKRWIAPLHRFRTVDVAQYFRRKDLVESGFEISLDKTSMKNGTYGVGLLFRNSKINSTALSWLDYQFEVDTPIDLIKASVPHEVSQDMKYSLYTIEPSIESSKIEAYAFLPSGICPACKGYITLNAPSSFFMAPANRTPRPDVVSYFKDSSLLNSGLKVVFKNTQLTKGAYKIGVLLKDTLKNIEFFSETNRLLHIGYDEFSKPSRVESIPADKDSVRAFADKIDNHNDFIEIKGWAFINELSTDYTETSVVLKSDRNIFVLPAMAEIRSDIQSYFNLTYNVDLSGFYVKFKREDLPDGNYQVCMLLLDKRTNKEYTQCLADHIEIRGTGN